MKLAAQEGRPSPEHRDVSESAPPQGRGVALRPPLRPVTDPCAHIDDPARVPTKLALWSASIRTGTMILSRQVWPNAPTPNRKEVLGELSERKPLVKACEILLRIVVQQTRGSAHVAAAGTAR